MERGSDNRELGKEKSKKKQEKKKSLYFPFNHLGSIGRCGSVCISIKLPKR